jgi:quinol monooxygenase YgiN
MIESNTPPERSIMSVIVVATAYPVPEHREAVVAAFEQTIARVHAEDAGCELYALHEGKDRLVMVEKWASGDALAAHGRGSALTALSAELDGKLTGALNVQVLRAHPAGTAEQGAI